MKKGFLLCDGQKNCILISQEDYYKPFGLILEEKIKGEEVKTHKTRAELNKTISEYLKGVYRVKPEDLEGQEVKPVEKHRNACGSCKYFEQAEITNKPWRKCQSVYKRGVHAGENRICYPSMNKCCDYVRKEANHDENN